jgi:hypothetical protein
MLVRIILSLVRQYFGEHYMTNPVTFCVGAAIEEPL